MQDKSAKSITIQWIMPLAVLFVTVLAMLINFSVSSKEKARAQVEQHLITTAENYGIRVKGKLDSIVGIQKAMAAMLAAKPPSNTAYIKDVVGMVAGTGEVYLAAYCNLQGKALVSNHEDTDLSHTSYFEELKGNESFFSYTQDDGIIGRSAILCVCPVMRGKKTDGYLISYYDSSKLSEIIKKIEFDMNSFYVLADSAGVVAWEYGAFQSTQLIDKGSFWDALSPGMESGRLEMVKMRLKNHTSGIAYVNLEEESKAIVYAPIGVEDYYLVMGINQKYLDREEGNEWKATRDMLLRLIVAVFIFLGLIAVINIITKIRAAERNRALEDKADTDLLTDLNNKLATERKIKEYMRDNPDKQGVMFVLDIDNFKKINDTMGHAFGDEVLRTLGNQIRAWFRVSDIIGRTGGDEFMIFLKDIKDDAIIEREGRKVEAFFRDFEAGEYVKYSVTASVGAAVFPRDAKSFEELYKAADRALYIAKKRGKNQLSFYKAGE